MNRQACYGIALALVLFLPRTSIAEVRCDIGVTFQPHEVHPITLRFRETSLRLLFRVIATITGTPFRVPPELDYRVTFDMRNVAACRVLEIIGESQSLTYLQDGDTIVVVPPPPEPTDALKVQ